MCECELDVLGREEARDHLFDTSEHRVRCGHRGKRDGHSVADATREKARRHGQRGLGLPLAHLGLDDDQRGDIDRDLLGEPLNVTRRISREQPAEVDGHRRRPEETSLRARRGRKLARARPVASEVQRWGPANSESGRRSSRANPPRRRGRRAAERGSRRPRSGHGSAAPRDTKNSTTRSWKTRRASASSRRIEPGQRAAARIRLFPRGKRSVVPADRAKDREGARSEEPVEKRSTPPRRPRSAGTPRCRDRSAPWDRCGVRTQRIRHRRSLSLEPRVELAHVVQGAGSSESSAPRRRVRSRWTRQAAREASGSARRGCTRRPRRRANGRGRCDGRDRALPPRDPPCPSTTREAPTTGRWSKHSQQAPAQRGSRALREVGHCRSRARPRISDPFRPGAELPSFTLCQIRRSHRSSGGGGRRFVPNCTRNGNESDVSRLGVEDYFGLVYGQKRARGSPATLPRAALPVPWIRRLRAYEAATTSWRCPQRARPKSSTPAARSARLRSALSPGVTTTPRHIAFDGELLLLARRPTRDARGPGLRRPGGQLLRGQRRSRLGRREAEVREPRSRRIATHSLPIAVQSRRIATHSLPIAVQSRRIATSHFRSRSRFRADESRSIRSRSRFGADESRSIRSRSRFGADESRSIRSLSRSARYRSRSLRYGSRHGRRRLRLADSGPRLVRCGSPCGRPWARDVRSRSRPWTVVRIRVRSKSRVERDETRLVRYGARLVRDAARFEGDGPRLVRDGSRSASSEPRACANPSPSRVTSPAAARCCTRC